MYTSTGYFRTVFCIDNNPSIVRMLCYCRTNKKLQLNFWWTGGNFFWDSGTNYMWTFWLSKGASILVLGPLLISSLHSGQLGFSNSHGSHRMNAFSNRKHFQYYLFPIETDRKITFSYIIRTWIAQYILIQNSRQQIKSPCLNLMPAKL